MSDRRFWFDGQGGRRPKSVAVLADEVARDDEFVAVLALWEGRPDVPVVASLEKLLASEAVPYLAAYRYKDSGLRKRAAWETRGRCSGERTLARTTQRQGSWRRRSDPGAAEVRERGLPRSRSTGRIAASSTCRRSGSSSIPEAGREGDPTPVIGWAGWDHAQQALALATLIQSGEQQGWSDERLIPLVAGLAELLPWVEQWHSDPDALYGGSSPAEFFSGLLDTYMAKIGVDPRNSQPVAPTSSHTR